MSRVIVPLDVSSKQAAMALVDRLGGQVDYDTAGIEIYTDW